ncbi:MAG: hypothetical protein ACK4IX_10755, partial [Candidatus Sericytochromatia bacterium]
MSENFNLGARFTPLDDPFMKEIGMDKFRVKNKVEDIPASKDEIVSFGDEVIISPEDTLDIKTQKLDNNINIEANLPTIHSGIGNFKIKQSTKLIQSTINKDEGPLATEPLIKKEVAERIDLGFDDNDNITANIFHEAGKSSGFEAKYKPLEGTEIIINQQNNLDTEQNISKVKKININSVLPSELGKLNLENEENTTFDGNVSRVNKVNFESQSGNFKALVQNTQNPDTSFNNRSEASYKFSDTDSIKVTQETTNNTRKNESEVIAEFFGTQIKHTNTDERQDVNNTNTSSTSISIPVDGSKVDSSKEKITIDYKTKSGEHSDSKVAYQHNDFVAEYNSNSIGQSLGLKYDLTEKTEDSFVTNVGVKRNINLDGTSNNSLSFGAKITPNVSVNLSHETSTNETTTSIEYDDGSGL